MEEKNNNKRVLSIELDDAVKKVSITGIGSDEKVVMKQELDEEDLKQATGGTSHSRGRIFGSTGGIPTGCRGISDFDRSKRATVRTTDDIWYEES